MRTAKRYGWRRDLPDHRDFKLSPPASISALPPKVDLRPECPPVYNQGELGSCTANAIGGAFEFEILRQGLKDFSPSRLFIYYNEREIEGDTDQDNGAQIRDGMKSIATQGVCPELAWPYIPAAFATKPSENCYLIALESKSVQYLSMAQDINHLKGCLADGFPFVVGISVFESFESDTVAVTGLVPMPGPKESCIGGHAVMAVGYDDTLGSFLMRNSWGDGWGLAGYFYLPYEYLTDSGLASDFWTVRSVEEGSASAPAVTPKTEVKTASDTKGFQIVENGGKKAILRVD